MKFKILTILIFIIISGLSFSNINSVIQNKLNESSSYQKSLENYISSKYSYSTFNNWFQPYLSISTNQLTGIKITKDGIDDIGLNTKLNFANILGANIGIQIPFNITTQENFNIDVNKKNINLSITYSLKSEYFSNQLSKESNLLSSEYSFKEIEDSTVIKTFEDVFNYYYISNNLEIQKEKLYILQQEYDDTEIEEDKNNLYKQILNQKSLINSLNNSLKNIDIDYSEDLYVETKNIAENISKETFNKNIESRNDLKSLELSKIIEEKQSKLWFLPLLPDLNFTFGVSNIDDLNWEFGINFQYDIIDRGEKLAQSLLRKSNISELTYNEKVNNIYKSINNSKNNIESLNIELQIKQLEYSNLLDNFEKTQKLFKLGYIYSSEYNISKLNLESKKIEVENQKNKILIEKMNLLNEMGLYIRGELN